MNLLRQTWICGTLLEGLILVGEVSNPKAYCIQNWNKCLLQPSLLTIVSCGGSPELPFTCPFSYLDSLIAYHRHAIHPRHPIWISTNPSSTWHNETPIFYKVRRSKETELPKRTGLSSWAFKTHWPMWSFVPNIGTIEGTSDNLQVHVN